MVVHVGRSSGATYYTPIDAHPTDAGYVLVIRYGPESDWVKNILAAGEAILRVDGENHRLGLPRLVGQEEAVAALPSGYEPGKDFFRASLYLLLATAE